MILRENDRSMWIDHLQSLFEYLQTTSIIILCALILDYAVLALLLTDLMAKNYTESQPSCKQQKQQIDDIIILSWPLYNWLLYLLCCMHLLLNMF